MKLLHPGREEGDGAAGGAPRLASLRERRVVLLDNHHFNVSGVLDRLGDRLVGEWGASVRHVVKPNANSPAPAGVLGEVLGAADAVINGIAD